MSKISQKFYQLSSLTADEIKMVAGENNFKGATNLLPPTKVG